MARLAETVEAKLREMNPRGKPITPNMFVLVALALANDAEEEREKRQRTERETRDLLRRMVSRIDLALEEEDGAPDDHEDASPEP
jgi:cell division protein ZapA (FtsZ GTPase activity inhibitor)